MKLNKSFASTVLILLFISFKSLAVKLSGQIRDENNQPLSYAIVYVSGTSNGTTANGEGVYSLELSAGSYEISFRMIGYALVKKQVTISNEPVTLDVKLTGESVKLKEVIIRANAEDPAYEIIRAAQKKRKFYRDQVKKYSANVYVKSTQQLTDAPKKIFGQDVDLSDVIDTATKIFYLSESVSELYYEQPDIYREKMISSKVSGSPKSYSFNQATNVLINLYDNLVDISGLTPRGIVSPVSGNALFYYKYRLEGTFSENGIMINKISVIPKRVTDPVFTGTIYIADNTWRIYSADLFITKNQQMEFVDTFRIKQNFIRVDDATWMPFSHQFEYSFGAFGFRGNGVVLGVFSDYNLGPEKPATFRKGEVMKVDETANKKDSTYWITTRPVPLTHIEGVDYHRRDSSLQIRESKSYLDSIDRKNNKFSFGDIFSGYYWGDNYHDASLNITSPIQKINFNTVEGWNAAMEIEYRKGFGKNDWREYSITPYVRYGFSNQHWNGHINFDYKYNSKHLSSIHADAGTNVVQINENEPISPMVNGAYTLFAAKNYMKLYEKQFINVYHQTELFNGFTLRIGAEYAHRISLSNSTDYSFYDGERQYTSNDPYHPETDNYRFPSHNALVADIGLSYVPGQEYFNRPEGKIIIGSKYPTLRINYKKGLNVAGSDVDYDNYEISIDDEMDLGLFGHLKYFAAYGDFLRDNKLFITDIKHFNGNKTWFSDFRINDFKNLDYYTYSTAGSFIELHGEENFGGFILNKIPIIRKLKLQEIAGIHYLHTEALDNYFDFSIGVEKLGFIRAELFTSLMNGKKGTVGFLIGFKKTIGN
jgi:hypothetical protein